MKILAIYKIDLGKESVPSEMYTTKEQAVFDFFMTHRETSYLMDRIFNTEKKLAFYLKYHENTCLLLLDKKTEKMLLLRNFINDIDNTAIPLMNYMDNSCFISVLDPIMLQQYYSFVSSTPDFRVKYKRLIQLTSQISSKSNPVIAFTYLK